MHNTVQKISSEARSQHSALRVTGRTPGWPDVVAEPRHPHWGLMGPLFVQR